MTDPPVPRGEALRRTFSYYALYVCGGLYVGILGPTLKLIADQTGAALESMGLVLLAGAGGSALGALAGGRIFDRVRAHPVMGVAQVCDAALIFLVPFIRDLRLLLVVVALKGITGGLVGSVANTLLVWTHGDKVGLYMNGLHFSFGLGAFLSPFLVAQVIGYAGGYRWAFWALAGFSAAAGILVPLLSAGPRPSAPARKGGSAAASLPIPWPLVLSAALYLFFYVGAEITFGEWLFTYAEKLGLAGDAEAAYLTSGFWLAFTLGRLASIPLATRIEPKRMIAGALAGCFAFLALIIALPGSRAVLWTVTLGLGLCMAPVWPTGFTLAGRSFPLSAKATSLIVIGDSIGSMVLPGLMGRVITAAGPRAMIWIILASLALNVAAFAAMLRSRHAAKERLGASD